jgi:putative ABC transport system ATP-binding protein
MDNTARMNDTAKSAAAAVAAIRVENLSKQVVSGDKPLTILHEIGFTVMPGETVAIVGVSGSGKSTLLGLLAGLDLPSTGKVWLAGDELFALDEDQRAALRARLLGFVFQSFNLLPAFSALENVMLPLELAGDGNARQRALDILDRVGLAARVTHYPKHLSGGEQQRVALARAFVSAPQLLLADEPTGNLDTATGSAVIDLMFELNREHGTTLVLVTHDNAIAEKCDTRLHLAAGKLVSVDHAVSAASNAVSHTAAPPAA